MDQSVPQGKHSEVELKEYTHQDLDDLITYPNETVVLSEEEEELMRRLEQLINESKQVGDDVQVVPSGKGGKKKRKKTRKHRKKTRKKKSKKRKTRVRRRR